MCGPQEKAKSSQVLRAQQRTVALRQEEDAGRLRVQAAQTLLAELQEKGHRRTEEAAALKREEDRLNKQRSYEGGARGQAQERRFRQLLLAQERVAKQKSLAKPSVVAENGTQCTEQQQLCHHVTHRNMHDV
jgi:hypothetical protein